MCTAKTTVRRYRRQDCVQANVRTFLLGEGAGGRALGLEFPAAGFSGAASWVSEASLFLRASSRAAICCCSEAISASFFSFSALRIRAFSRRWASIFSLICSFQPNNESVQHTTTAVACFTRRYANLSSDINKMGVVLKLATCNVKNSMQGKTAVSEILWHSSFHTLHLFKSIFNACYPSWGCWLDSLPPSNDCLSIVSSTKLSLNPRMSSLVLTAACLAFCSSCSFSFCATSSGGWTGGMGGRMPPLAKPLPEVRPRPSDDSRPLEHPLLSHSVHPSPYKSVQLDADRISRSCASLAFAYTMN